MTNLGTPLLQCFRCHWHGPVIVLRVWGAASVVAALLTLVLGSLLGLFDLFALLAIYGGGVDTTFFESALGGGLSVTTVVVVIGVHKVSSARRWVGRCAKCNAEIGDIGHFYVGR